MKNERQLAEYRATVLRLDSPVYLTMADEEALRNRIGRISRRDGVSLGADSENTRQVINGALGDVVDARANLSSGRSAGITKTDQTVPSDLLI